MVLWVCLCSLSQGTSSPLKGLVLVEVKDTIKQSKENLDRSDDFRFATMKASARAWISKAARNNKLSEVTIKQAYNELLDIFVTNNIRNFTPKEMKVFHLLVDSLKSIEETAQILDHLRYQLEKRFTVKGMERSLELTRFHAKKKRKT